MTMNILLKSKSTGLVGSYPERHKDLSDDLTPVDGNGDICLPCMGIEVEVTPEPENIPEPELEVAPEPKNKTTNRKDVK